MYPRQDAHDLLLAFWLKNHLFSCSVQMRWTNHSNKLLRSLKWQAFSLRGFIVCFFFKKSLWFETIDSPKYLTLYWSILRFSKDIVVGNDQDVRIWSKGKSHESFPWSVRGFQNCQNLEIEKSRLHYARVSELWCLSTPNRYLARFVWGK